MSPRLNQRAAPLGNVQPELADHRPELRQVPLEFVDPETLLHASGVQYSPPLHQHAAVRRGRRPSGGRPRKVTVEAPQVVLFSSPAGAAMNDAVAARSSIWADA